MLTLLNVDEQNQGNYMCIASNRYGTAQGLAPLQLTTSMPSVPSLFFCSRTLVLGIKVYECAAFS